MLSQKEIFGLARDMAGNNDVVAISMSLVRFTGSWTAGAILSQLLYWSDKTKISGGWICKTHDEWHEELMLTRDKVRPAIAMLKKSGTLEVKMKKFDGAPKPHYRIIEKVFKAKFYAFLNRRVLLQSENPTVGKPYGQTDENPTVKPTEIPQSTEGKSDEPITEITTESYSETTTEIKKTPPEGDGVSEGPKQSKWEGTGSEEEQPTYISGQPEKEEEKSSAKKEEESHDTKTESSLSDLPQGRFHGAVAVQEEHNQLEHDVSDLDSAGQATGQAQPLAEDLSQRQWEKLYKDAWWEFYKTQKNSAEPPNSWRNHYTFGGPLKEIQQDLAAEFGGNEEKAYQEFVSILSGWQHPKNYHRHRLKPKQIHNHLEEIRGIINEDTGKISGNINKIPVLGEALEIFREAHLEQRQFYPSLDERYDLPQLGKTLEYLKSLQPDATWEDALQLFTFICNKWPDLERQDEFYAQHFTIRYIHGNTSKIINLLKSGAKKQPDLSPAAAAAWLARNGAAQQR